ncbi:MAG: ABC transporter ATP-binding protein [Deltaproteobacteria bacterium]|nr:ABC transporter ATP-binding protein [Deltaproteobacteria bacterium]
MERCLLDIEKLRVFKNDITIVHDFTLNLNKNEIHSVIGESGSGKSLSVQVLNGILPEPLSWTGKVTVESVSQSHNSILKLRGVFFSMIFQDSAGALNPVRKIGAQISETVRYHKAFQGKELSNEVNRLLDISGLTQDVRNSYAHELSGGMKQRCAIALALSCDPKVLICDEPTTALDPTTAGNILDEFIHLSENGYSIIFITHDFGNILRLRGRLTVMYAGYCVETGLVDRLSENPFHPYTAELLKARPEFGKELYSIPGEMPSPTDAFTGCPFAPRCFNRSEICYSEMPPWSNTSDGSSVRCHNPVG